MAWGMFDNKKETELKPAEENPWYQFYLATRDIDRGKGTFPGFHWFWGIYNLQNDPENSNFRNIKRLLPMNHWIRVSSIPISPKELQTPVKELLKKLVNLETIKEIDFSGLHFKTDIDFSELIFPIQVSFAGSKFSGDANFTDTMFASNANFTNAIFSDDVAFSNAGFADIANFKKTEFYGIVHFLYTEFHNRTLFGEAKFFNKTYLMPTFFGPTSFSKVEFSIPVDFNNATFLGNAFFYDTKFFDSVDFNKTKISKQTFFKDTKFYGIAKFIETKFLGNINFNKTTFFVKTYFNDATFSTKAVFKNVKFLDDAYFIKTIFSETADFRNTCFHGKTAKFKNTIFKKIADFTGATFKGYANFKGSKFKGRTKFQAAEFKIHAPRFYGAKLSKEITWNKITWPKSPNVLNALLHAGFRKLGYEWADTDHKPIVRENQNSYEDLANLMEKLDKYHDQHLFFRKEMYCRRQLEPLPTRSFYWLYGTLADYGYGIGRTFIAWFIHIFIGFIALLFIACRGYATVGNPIGCSFSVSVANSHAFFFKGDRLKKCYEIFENLPWFNFIWGVQTIMGTLFLFLLLLTLRVRFRIK